MDHVENILNGEKLCFICEKEPAKYNIKGLPNDCYCEECAVDSFGSVEYLEKR